VVEKTETMGSGGKVLVGENDIVTGIEEGDHRGTPGLMNTNLIVLDERIFEYPMVPKADGSSEYGLPQTVLKASLAGGIPLHAVYATSWIQITSPEDLARADSIIAP
jgi:NDP-sugar pyrophosphorylase family protein